MSRTAHGSSCPNMDPFATIPAEIRLEILFRLDNSEQVRWFSYASPTIFQQRRISAGVLSRHFRCKDLTNDLVQDAMAIILFPTRSDPPNYRREIGLNPDEIKHLEIWSKKQLPNPLETGDPDLMKILDSLITQITLYMEDYLSKATSACMSRAYSKLPDWAHSSWVQHSPESEPMNSINFRDLTVKERSRLMKAFLRHEILCKMYHPRPGITFWRYIDWDWRYLEELENLSVQQHSSFSRTLFSTYVMPREAPRNLELLQCVSEYIRTLYGALATQVPLGDWYIPPNSDHQNRSLGVSTRDIDRDLYYNDYWLHVREVECSFDAQLASCGFNLLTSLLRSEKSSAMAFFGDFVKEAYNNRPVRIESSPLKRLGGRICPENLLITWRDTEDPNANQRWLQHRHVRTCRQRAWALFDNARLYPHSSEFAAISGYEARENWFWTRYHDRTEFRLYEHRRWERNTQIWYDPRRRYVTPDYPSLSNRIRNPFWQEEQEV